MTLPIATQRVALERADDVRDRDSLDDPPDWRTIAEDVRCVISGASGSERTDRAEALTMTATLGLDPMPGVIPTHLDRLVDQNGTTWGIVWIEWAPGLGLDHWRGQVVRYDGQEP